MMDHNYREMCRMSFYRKNKIKEIFPILFNQFLRIVNKHYYTL